MADSALNTLDQRRAIRPAGGTRARAETPACHVFVAAGGPPRALAAASCRVAPLVLFTLGVTGAWIGTAGALAPYQPIFVAVTPAFLVAGYFMAYGRPKEACAEELACARSLSSRTVKLTLWTATALVAAAVAFSSVVPSLLVSERRKREES